MVALYNPTQEGSNLDILDNDNRNTLDRAVRNVLGTEPAERAYAQILDGLPTEQSLRDSQDYVKDHPVHSTEHSEICPGYKEKAREFRNGFDLSQLQFESKVRSSRSMLTDILNLYILRHWRISKIQFRAQNNSIFV